MHADRKTTRAALRHPARSIPLPLSVLLSIAAPVVAQANQPPRASDDAYATPAGVALVVGRPGVLANDSNPEGDPMFANAVVFPRFGTLTLAADGSFVYTPAPEFTGQDRFSYQANEGRPLSSSNVAIATISVGNAAPLPPTARTDLRRIEVDTALVMAAPGVLDNDGDPNGDPLAASLFNPPTHGVVVVGDDGAVDYVPDPGFVGTDILQYRATDPTGLSAIGDLFIGVNRPARFGLHAASAVPAVPIDVDQVPVTVGVRFRTSVPGVVNALRFYKGTALAGDYALQLWRADRSLLSSVRVNPGSRIGWIDAPLGEFAVRLEPGVEYVAAVFAPNGRYPADEFAFPAAGLARGPLFFPGADGGGNGVYVYGATPGAFPDRSYRDTDYYVDIVFEADGTPPVARADAYSISPDGTLEQGIAGGLLANDTDDDDNPFTATLASAPAHGSVSVSPNGSFSYVAATGFRGTDTFTYTIRDARGLTSVPASVSIVVADDFDGGIFHTADGAGPAPAATATDDTAAVTLGMRFTTSRRGYFSGARFHKSTVSSPIYTLTLWDDAGRVLWRREAGFGSGTGWVGLRTEDDEVLLEPGRTYTVGYFTPIGRYAITHDFFRGQGVENGPLRALGAGDGGNGVFAYGPSSTFPTRTYRDANYHVDVIFRTAR